MKTTNLDSTIDEIEVWFDVNIGHGHCPDDETVENCKYTDLKQLIRDQRLIELDLLEQAIEAYIAEQIIEKLEHLATSDPRYTYAALKDELAELKSNER